MLQEVCFGARLNLDDDLRRHRALELLVDPLPDGLDLERRLHPEVLTLVAVLVVLLEELGLGELVEGVLERAARDAELVEEVEQAALGVEEEANADSNTEISNCQIVTEIDDNDKTKQKQKQMKT